MPSPTGRFSAARFRSRDPNLLELLLLAIQAERQTLRAHPSDFTSIIANRLASGTLTWDELDAALQLGGRPLLRREGVVSIGPEATSFVEGRGITTCAVRSDQVVAGTDDGRLFVWRNRTSPLAHPDVITGAHEGAVSFLAFAEGEEVLLSGGADGIAHVWDSSWREKSGPLENYREGTGLITTVVQALGGRMLVAGTEDGAIGVWDRGTEHPRWRLIGHTAAITALATTPLDSRLVSASRDATLRVWKLETGRQTASMHGHAGPVVGCAFVRGASSSEFLVLSASADRLVKVWTMDGQPFATLGAHEGEITDLREVKVPTGSGYNVPRSVIASECLTAGADGTVRLWDLEAMRESQVVRLPADVVQALPQGTIPSRVLSATSDRVCRISDLDNGRVLRGVRAAGAGRPRLTVADTGDLATCVTEDGTLTRIDLAVPPNSSSVRLALDASGWFLSGRDRDSADRHVFASEPAAVLGGSLGSRGCTRRVRRRGG